MERREGDGAFDKLSAGGREDLEMLAHIGSAIADPSGFELGPLAEASKWSELDTFLGQVSLHLDKREDQLAFVRRVATGLEGMHRQTVMVELGEAWAMLSGFAENRSTVDVLGDTEVFEPLRFEVAARGEDVPMGGAL